LLWRFGVRQQLQDQIPSRPADKPTVGAEDPQLDLLIDVLKRVRAGYFEKPDDAKLAEAAIKGMLSKQNSSHHSISMERKHGRWRPALPIAGLTARVLPMR
jgi:C-terminal processing protease CtpA/Prc